MGVTICDKKSIKKNRNVAKINHTSNLVKMKTKRGQAYLPDEKSQPGRTECILFYFLNIFMLYFVSFKKY